MKCDVCQGACCEEAKPGDGVVIGPDVMRWIQLHVQTDGSSGRCRALDPVGRCDIYTDRPMMCAMFAEGGPDCLATVAALRTPAQYQLIRDASDPLTL